MKADSMPIFVRAWTRELPCARHAYVIWSRLVRKGAIKLSRDPTARTKQRKQFKRKAALLEKNGTILRLIKKLQRMEQRWDREHPPREIPQWAPYALVLDCETTIDLYHELNFCWWRFCELVDDKYVVKNEGVFWRDDLPIPKIQLIRKYARSQRADVVAGGVPEIRCESRAEFMNGIFHEAIRMGASIVNLNLAFDLSCIVEEMRPSKSLDGGWTGIPWPNATYPDEEGNQYYRPCIRFIPKDSRVTFMRLSGGPGCEPTIRRYCFLDLGALGWALRNVHGSLEWYGKSFNLPPENLKDSDHEPTGEVSKDELSYGRQDVRASVALLNAMKSEFDGFGLKDLKPERCTSPASITKAMLGQMEIVPPLQKFRVSDKYQGRAMMAYFGGRSEAHIRHEEIPCVVTDVTSEYPTCAALLGIWDLLTAESVEIRNCTATAKRVLAGATLDSLLDPAMFRTLAFFARMKPTGNSLPIRAIYDGREDSNTTIGINHLHSENPLWFAGPDLAAAALLDGRPPEIEEAFCLIPKGKQKLKEITLGGRLFDPATEDFFRFVIEQRSKLPKTHPHYLLLKIIANSLYGVFAQLDKKTVGKNSRATIYVVSGDYNFTQKTHVLEKPGHWAFPPAAALITSGGRLLLALLEKMAMNKGGTYVLTDTDSMFFVSTKRGGSIECEGGPSMLPDGRKAVRALRWKEVDEICGRLGSLNPYDPKVVDRLLKTESINNNRAGKQVPLNVFCVASKRYEVHRNAIRDLVECAELIDDFDVEIIKASQHGLGTYFVPDKRPRYVHPDCGDGKTTYPRYLAEIWADILRQWGETLNDPVELRQARNQRQFPFAELPAMRKVRISTPNILRAMRRHDSKAARAYNFCQSPVLHRMKNTSTPLALVGAFSKRPEEWLAQEYVDIKTGEKIRLGATRHGEIVRPATLSDVSNIHWRHPEPKFLGPDGQPCSEFTRGVLSRRTIHAGEPRFWGKEVERRIEGGEYDLEASQIRPIEYQPGKGPVTRMADADKIERAKAWPKKLLARKAGVSRNTVKAYLAGKLVRPGPRLKIERAVLLLEERTN